MESLPDISELFGAPGMLPDRTPASFPASPDKQDLKKVKFIIDKFLIYIFKLINLPIAMKNIKEGLSKFPIHKAVCYRITTRRNIS